METLQYPLEASRKHLAFFAAAVAENASLLYWIFLIKKTCEIPYITRRKIANGGVCRIQPGIAAINIKYNVNI